MSSGGYRVNRVDALFLMAATKPYRRSDVCRSVRLPLEINRQFCRLAEQAGITRNAQLKKAVTLYIRLFA